MGVPAQRAPQKPRIVVLQKYVAPYRSVLFDAIAATAQVDLVVLCYGRPERRRDYGEPPAGRFTVVHAAGLSIPLGYEANVEVPFGLPHCLAGLAPRAVVCAPDWGGIVAAHYCKSHQARLLIWSEATLVTEAGCSRIKSSIRRRIYGGAHGFFVPGRLAREYIEAMGGAAPFVELRNSIDDAHFSVDHETLEAKYRNPRQRIFTFSGSIVARKGVVLLIEAFSRARARAGANGAQCELRILGRGPLEATVGAAAGIAFAGHVAGDEYRRLMAQTHVFVLPSLWDCNPLVVVEALHSGASLLVSDGVGSHPEAVQENGYVVARGDLDALTDALAGLMVMPWAELRRMGLRSLALAREFATERAARAFVTAVQA